jgi:hypothetical protein
MVPRALFTVVALLLAATAFGVSEGSAQTQDGNLNELWERYPLDAPEEGPRAVGAREEDGSTAGPPPEPPDRAGPFPHALLFLALGLAVVGVAGAVRQTLLVLRARRSGGAGELGGGAGDLGR